MDGMTRKEIPMRYTIPKGSFAGTEVPLHQLVQAPDGNALLWPVAERYPLFRALFPAEAGWSLTTTRETLQERMPAYDEFNQPYRHGEEILLFPTMLITATLTDPNGRVVADATTLVELGSRKAYEMGENNARSRLFESLGLPAAFDARLFTPGGNVTALPQASANGGNRGSRSAPMTAAVAEIAVTPAAFTTPASTDAPATPVVVTDAVIPATPATSAVRTPSRPAQPPASAKAAAVPSGLSAGAINRAQQAAARAGQPFRVEDFRSNAELMAFAAKMADEARRAAKAPEAGAA
jgi:hypothetical protein